MATKTTIALEITANAQQAEQSVGSFKKQLREATAELVSMSEKFGLSSVEATNAAKKVAGLKDAIGDAKALSDTFNPDKKFVALGGALQGAVGGFTALTGAMGLFGGESEEVQKMLIKVQSAMALQQGISGVMGAVDSFKLLAAGIAKTNAFQKLFSVGTAVAATVTKAFGVAVETTSTGFKLLRAAIISTGIGALVVGITLLVQSIVEWASSTESLKESQERLKKSVDDTTEAIDAQRHAASNATNEALALAKAQGKSASELYKITSDGFKEDERLQGVKLRSLYSYYETQKSLFDNGKIEQKDYDEALKKYTDASVSYNDLKSQQKIAQYNEEGRIRDENERRLEKSADKMRQMSAKEKEAYQKRLEELRQIESNRVAQEKETNDLITDNRLSQIKDEYFKSQAQIDIQRQTEIDKQTEYLNKKLISEQDYYNRLYYINDTFDTQQQALADEKAAKDAEALAAKKEKDLQEKEAARMQMVTDAQTDAELRLAIAEQINEINPEDTPEGAALKIENIEAAKLAAEQAAFEVKILQAQGNNERIRLLTEQHENNIKGIVKSSTDAQILYERQMNQAKMDAAISYAGKVSGLLDSISETVGKNTAEGKALSIASATIQAITGAVQAYTGMTTIPVVGVALGVVAAAAALAAGFANVKKIANTKVPGKYGGGSSAVSVPSAPSLPPSLIPKTPTMLGSANTSLDQNSINSIGNAAARVFVLETDIANNQERITRLNRAARIS